jgi:hypothetical protein
MPEQQKQPHALSRAAAQEAPQRESVSSGRRKRKSGMPLLLKISLISFLLFIALLGGLITGYSIVGDGAVLDVFNLKTWKHMYDLVFG